MCLAYQIVFTHSTIHGVFIVLVADDDGVDGLFVVDGALAVLTVEPVEHHGRFPVEAVRIVEVFASMSMVSWYVRRNQTRGVSSVAFGIVTILELVLLHGL